MGLLNKIELGVTVIASVNSTVNGRAPSYNNPIIPKGFRAINTTTIWPTDWNTGLVIEDASANQFVWVPVDGTDVKYIKWCVVGQVYNDARITDDTLPIGITNESNQITKYGGFYIARYEAGKVSTSTLVSKKDAIVWNSTDYTDAKTVSELMYNTAEVKSHLITGTQWDTTMEWIKDSGKNVTDSTTWGNYSNSTFPANVSGFGNKQVAGYSENWKANNIYDLAGGMVEWTNENFGSDRVIRGGDFPQTGNYAPASSRDYQQPSYAPYFIYQNYSFRVSLYIL